MIRTLTVGRLRRTGSVLVAAVVVAGCVVIGAVPQASAAGGGASGSAVTKSGKGAFADLEVSVSKTRDLVDEVVQVTWKGGRPTTPAYGSFYTNYVQIMQCWGDDEGGPAREQCQYGGTNLSGDNPGGAQGRSRQVETVVVDPRETLVSDDPAVLATVPFHPVGDAPESGTRSKFFDGQSTNEVPYGRTMADGTGADFFNVQTKEEAPGLGCGDPVRVGGEVEGRSCWLVVVPRGDREVDGSPAANWTFGGLITSPLSQTNWDQRIVFPLEFETVGQTCRIGSAERKVVGHEVVSEAFLRWQPALCADGATVYGYSQGGDSGSRRDLLDESPGMSVVSRGLTADENTEARPLLYAPLATSALTFAFNVDHQALVGSAPPAVLAKNGRRITDMKLTPRLVVKLLTQSYKAGSQPGSKLVSDKAPADLVKDKEFLALNPHFENQAMELDELVVPVNRADVLGNLWSWLMTDADARAFVGGAADPHGMTINSAYKGMDTAIDDFPRMDGTCTEPVPDQINPGDQSKTRPAQCMFDFHPYADDLLGAARAAARGDLLTRTTWDRDAIPPSYKRDPNQPSGVRAMLVVTDTASAARYGLETAAIRNAAGEFVEPTVDAMQAAVTEMQPSSVPGNLAPALTPTSKAAYPLTSVSYAALAPTTLSKAERVDYAKVLTYAADDGQRPGLKPGMLPAGYAPLDDALRAQTYLAAERLLRGEGTPGSTGTDEGDVPPDPDEIAKNAPVLPDGLTGSSSTPLGDTPVVDGAADLTGATVPVASGSTPWDAAGLLRFAPWLALFGGLLLVAAGPGLILANSRGVTVGGAVTALKNRLPVFGN